MDYRLRGLVAGVVATIMLSILMVIQEVTGMMPQLNMIDMLTGMANDWIGLPAVETVGWFIHFTVGIVVYGLGYAYLDGLLPGSSRLIKGIEVGVIGWLIMSIILMPIAGQGLFALNIGIIAPIAILILHILFGAVLGWTYDKTPSKAEEG